MELPERAVWALLEVVEPPEAAAVLLELELLLPQALNAIGAATQRSATSLVWIPVNRRNLSPFTMRACARFAYIENVTNDQTVVKQFRRAAIWS